MVSKKSLGSAPVIEMPLMLIVEEPLFFSVAVFVLLVVPTA